MSILTFVLSFLLSAFLTWRFCDPASRLHILDQPNERSLHEQPTPRSGGVAIFLALAVAFAIGSWRGNGGGPVPWVAVGALAIATISLIDDLRGVPPLYRLGAHLLAAGFAIAAGLTLATVQLPGLSLGWPLWLGATFSILFIVWMLNLYNFMDGMDGFSGGMTMAGFGTFAVLGALAGEMEFMFWNLVVVAAVAGFLVFNFPPARIFMGDVGSSVLGFLAAAFSLWGSKLGVFPFWVAVLVFSPFVVDATVTLVRRLLRGEKVWEAHRTHYYQRLVRMGWGHRRTLLWEYALMALCAAAAILAVNMGPAGQWSIVLVVAALYVGLMSWVDRRAPRSPAPRASTAKE